MPVMVAAVVLSLEPVASDIPELIVATVRFEFAGKGTHRITMSSLQEAAQTAAERLADNAG